MAYKSKYSGLQIDDILDSVGSKQDKIDDLASIRAGATKGATALQSYTEKYTGTVTGIKINGETKSGSGVIDLGTISTDISGKQDKLVDGVNIATINGQSLTEGGDLTIEAGTKVYEWFCDDESESVMLSQEEYDNIVGADIVIVNMGGLVSFIVNRTGKDLSEAAGMYILQGKVVFQEGEFYVRIDINISTKLATITLEQQEIPTKTSDLENDNNFITSEDVAAVALSGSYNDLSNKPTIPSAVTESTVSGWGFTKNPGTYSKPSTGIPKSDLASAVQTSLGKADTALQSYTEQYKGTITGVSANGTSVATSGVANIPAASTSAYGVTKLSSATNSTSTTLAATASAVKAAYDLANSYKGTVTGVKVNGTTKSPTSGTVDIGNVVTSVKINGSSKNPTSGVVDLGTVVTDISGKQDKLVSGTNIKTINGTSILGSGNIEISGGGSSNANVQAVATGDVIDDVTVDYATKTYVDVLVGDINSVLESIING